MRDNALVLDARTGGDPGGASKWLVSSSSTGGSWVARATAVLDAIGYTPVNDAGDVMTGTLTFNGGFGVQFGGNAGATRSFLADVAATALRILAHADTIEFRSQDGVTLLAKVTSAGQIQALSAAITNTITAFNMVLTDDISAADASFSGALSAASAVFAGALTAGAINGASVGATGGVQGSVLIASIADGTTPPLTINVAQANVAVPNLKSAKATLADSATSADDADTLAGQLPSQTGSGSRIVQGNGTGKIDLTWISGLTHSQMSASNVDGVAGTASLRTIGTGAQQAAAGNHGGHTQAQSHGSPDTDTATSALHHTLGTGPNQAAAGNHGHTAQYATGTYTGNGAPTRTISGLPFTPTMVLVAMSEASIGTQATITPNGTMAAHVNGAIVSNISTPADVVSGTTFQVSTTSGTNLTTYDYTWVAWD